MSDIDKRLDKLETKAQPDGPIGVYYDGETVHILGEDTGLTPEEFAAQYPNGLLLHVVYRSTPIESDGAG